MNSEFVLFFLAENGSRHVAHKRPFYLLYSAAFVLVWLQFYIKK